MANVCENINAILPVASSIVTLIITCSFNCLLEHIKSRNENKRRVWERRVEVYQVLYNALNEYRDFYRLFVSRGNEYKESAENNEFGSLTATEKLSKVYERNNMFCSKEVSNLIEELIGSGRILYNLAIMVAPNQEKGDQMDDFLHNSVEKSSEMMIDRIECIMEKMKLESMN